MLTKDTIARLPRIEIAFYFAVWIIHSITAFYIAWDVSSRFRNKLYLGNSNYVNDFEKDYSDLEWTYHLGALGRSLLIWIPHMVLFKVCPLLLPKQLSQCFLLVFWIGAQIYLTSANCVMTVFALALIMGILVRCWRNEPVCWFVVVILVVKINSVINFNKKKDVYYMEFNYYLYSVLKIINFCIYLSRNKDINASSSLFLRYAQYIFYPPYATVLIVLFDDFDAQMTKVENDQSGVDYRALLLRLPRIIIWFVVFEALLHFIYVNALFLITPKSFSTLSDYEIASVAYVNGKLFYMKYLLIFGIPAWFASADGMKPPAAPICISRISKYSQMWRTFDRGLYIFLKKQVYVPVIGDSSGKYFVARRFAAMIAVFLFVLMWHGTSSSHVYWILLNSLELCIEWFGSVLSRSIFYYNMKKLLGPRGERRLIAVAMIATVVPGIFGIFFFLSRPSIGILIFKRLCVTLLDSLARTIFNLPGRSLKLFGTAVHFLLLGYCFNNVCLELEKYFARKEVSEAKIKKN